MKIKLIFTLGVITLLAGCSNVFSPPEAPADKAGTVTFTVDQGSEARTVFPSLSQFSKVALTFAGSPPVEEAIVSGGSVTLNLPQGSWTVTADAYIGDVLAAHSIAHSISWTGSGDIAGETRFVLGPIGSGGNGTLKGIVTPPAGITLGALSRIAIEGQAEIPVTGAMEGEVSLPEGRYYVDVVLENEKTGATAVYRRVVAILSGLTTEIRFAPSAAEFLSGEARAALSSVEGLVFGPTATNAAGIAVDDEDWVNGNIRIAAPGGTTELHFTVYNPNALTLTAANATSVSGTTEGSTSSANLSVFKVDTGELNGNNGAELAVTITAAEQSREGVPITVTVTLAPTFTDIGELTTYFAGLAPNTAATSYAVKLEGFNLGAGDLAALGDPLGKVYQAAGQKYFSLDMSGCTGNLGYGMTSRASKTWLVNCVLPDDLTSIGASAFNNCISLASVTLPDTLTSIGTGAFRGCVSLASLALPDSLTILGNDAFRDCYSLTSVTVPGSVAAIGTYAFAYCPSLESVVLNVGLETIGANAFYNCGALVSVAFPVGLKTINSNAFVGTSLSSVVLYEGLTYLGETNIVGLEYSSAFTGTPIVSVVLPSTLKSIGYYTFADCASLSSVTIPEGVETIGNYAFANNASLVSVTLPSTVTTIGRETFSNCRLLESINLEGVTDIGFSAFIHCSSLRGPITLSTTSILDELFYDCSSLAEVVLHSGITSIGVSAFANCVSLNSINLPEGLTTINSTAFRYCTSLSLTLPSTLETLGSAAFVGVIDITVAQGNTAFNVPAGSKVLLNAAGDLLRCFDTGNVDLSAVSAITGVSNNAFAGDTITSVILPTSATLIRPYAFQNASALVSVDMPEATSIASYSFDGCTALTTVTLPKAATVGTYAFRDCTALTTVSLSALTSVGANAFNGCTALTTITLPATLTSIGANAFTNCINLVSVTIERTTPPTVTATSFNNTAPGLKIYVPAASLTAYQAANVWSTATYVDKLAAIPSI